MKPYNTQQVINELSAAAKVVCDLQHTYPLDNPAFTLTSHPAYVALTEARRQIGIAIEELRKTEQEK